VERKHALQRATAAFILDFAHPKKQVWTALRAANEIVEEIARRTGGLIWDEQTREVFSPDAWHHTRLAEWPVDSVPKIASQTVIHLYTKDEYERAITLGMIKAGLPDVVVEGFPTSSNSEVGDLINLFCQSMSEGNLFTNPGDFRLDLHAIKNSNVRDEQLKSLKKNGIGKACLSLRPVGPDDGDPPNRLIEIDADKYAGDDDHARLDLMLDTFFGWEDSISYIEDNEELLAA